jgi:hypothetical protein
VGPEAVRLRISNCFRVVPERGPTICAEAAAGTYIAERNRRVLEDNRRQIAEAEQRQREFEKQKAAEAEAAKERDRQAYRERGWPSG